MRESRRPTPSRLLSVGRQLEHHLGAVARETFGRSARCGTNRRRWNGLPSTSDPHRRDGSVDHRPFFNALTRETRDDEMAGSSTGTVLVAEVLLHEDWLRPSSDRTEKATGARAAF